MRYAELQTTTNFSFLRGASHGEELVAQAKALGLDAIAVTDRNTFAGIVRAHVAAKEAGLRFIVGVRLDLEDGLSLLAYPADRKAYGRLSRLISLGQGRAGKGKCRLYLDDVAAHAEGQIFIALPPETWDWREALRQGTGRAVEGAQILPFSADRSFMNSPPPGGEGLGVGGARRRDRSCEHLHENATASSVHFRTPLSNPIGIRPDLRPTPGPSPSRGGEFSSSRGSEGDHVRPSPQHSHHSSVRNGGREKLASALPRLKSALGAAPLYLAASHTFSGHDAARIAALARMAGRCGTPLVATGDVLYHTPHRRPLQDVLTARARAHDRCASRLCGLHANAERHIKRPREMARLFKGHEARADPHDRDREGLPVLAR